MARKPTSARFRRLLYLLGLFALVYLGLGAFRAGAPPQITIEPRLPGIGKRTPVDIRVEEGGRGLSEYHVELVQGRRTRTLESREQTPLEPWQFWGQRIVADDMTVEVGSETVENLEEGTATLRVVAARAPAWLRRPDPVVGELQLTVKLRPPSLQVLSARTYVSQGGSEAVVYQVDESSVHDGVQAGDWWFPGYPLPGGAEGQRFALFAAPYDLPDAESIRLVAEDNVGNVARTSFVDRFTPSPPKRDTIRLSDGFMQKVVPAIQSQTPGLRDRGNLLENYLEVNRELRRLNNAKLLGLAGESTPEFLWSERFLAMRNAKKMSDFADHRTYVYQGREVDRQDHLGYDLASTRRAPIEAANDGIVLLAEYLGIYGNAVVIDHGYGLMSLYGHLSTLEVETGRRVTRGETIGRSGETGLAGGDHLHFSMMLQGLPVDAKEWWDDHWIHDRLELKLGDALPFEN